MGRIVLLLLFVSSAAASEETCLKALANKSKMEYSVFALTLLQCGVFATTNENGLWTNAKLGHMEQARRQELKDACLKLNHDFAEHMRNCK